MKKKAPNLPRTHKYDFLFLPLDRENFTLQDLNELNPIMSRATVVRRVNDLMLENLVVRSQHGVYTRHPSWA